MSVLNVVSLPHKSVHLAECARRSLKSTDTCAMPGINAEIIGRLIELLKVPYKVTFYPNKTAGIETVSNGENGSDMLTMLWKETEKRRNIFDFTYPITSTEPKFLVRMIESDFSKRVSGILEIFTVELWLSLFVTVISMKILIGLFSRMLGVKKIRNLTVITAYTILIFGHLYRGGILGRLLTVHRQMLFKKPEQMVDMIQKRQIKMILHNKRTWIYGAIMNTRNDRFFEKLQEALHNNPIEFEPNYEKLVRKVATGKYVTYISSELELARVRNIDCNLGTVKGKGMKVFNVGFSLRKNSSWLSRINNAISKSWHFYEVVERRYLHNEQRISKCQDLDKSPHLQKTPLRLKSLQTVFQFFAYCCGIAIGVLVFELASKRTWSVAPKVSVSCYYVEIAAIMKNLRLVKNVNFSNWEKKNLDEIMISLDEIKKEVGHAMKMKKKRRYAWGYQNKLYEKP